MQEESKTSEEVEVKQDSGFSYIDVVCGSSQTLGLIDQPPYLLCWGNGDPVARTYSEIFEFDRPVAYDCGGKNAVVLTDKGDLYKINLETKAIDKVTSAPHAPPVLRKQESAFSEDQISRGIVSLACGSDFILALKTDGNVYALGQNKSGQLG